LTFSSRSKVLLLKDILHCLRKLFQICLRTPLFSASFFDVATRPQARSALLPSRTSDDTLKNQWKIVMRQAAVHLSHAVLIAREEIQVEKGWKTPAKRALLQQVAPQYQSASASHKKQILAQFMTSTGYVRKYAMWVLNHAEEILQTTAASPQRYRPEVQEALVLAWETLNRICAKRLMPFLPSIIESLEQFGYLQLSEESRHILLSMSAATADRQLRSQRYRCLRSLSTTKAGPLLKEQIPIRTFSQWNEAHPGFLEVDLVAHCGPHNEGSFLYTLTLTDVATGWTECLPLLNRGQEAVLAALQRARTLFPFPILGINTDNGGEFLNEEVVTYCAREQITFTRGRPYEKRDQCFVEQKNGVVVRQVVGRDRFEGEHTARQLTELYRALRLYVNCFQPSMKLRAKDYEGRKVRRVYDPAKTPLQRLLLSGVLPASEQHELRSVVRALDPLHLFQLLQQLQQAVFRCAVGRFSTSQTTPPSPLLVFVAGRCTAGLVLSLETEPGPGGSPLQRDCQESLENTSVLNWRRTCKDPFVGQWEQILSWLQGDPTRTSGDIFRSLQALFPGRYQPLQVRTLQRGMRKIRAHVLTTCKEQWQQELIHGDPPITRFQEKEPIVEHHPNLPLPVQPAATALGTTSAPSCSPQPPRAAPLAHSREQSGVRRSMHLSHLVRNNTGHTIPLVLP
jgi:Integrase core domain